MLSQTIFENPQFQDKLEKKKGTAKQDPVNQFRSPSVSNDQSNVFFIEDPDADGLEAGLAGSVIIPRSSTRPGLISIS